MTVPERRCTNGTEHLWRSEDNFCELVISFCHGFLGPNLDSQACTAGVFIYSAILPPPNNTRHWLCFPLSHFDRSIMILNISSYFCSPTSYSFAHFQSLGNPRRHIQKHVLQLPGHSSTQQGWQDYPSLGHSRFRGKGPLAASYRGLGTQIQVLMLV